MEQIDTLSGKRVAIIGFARQGRALARWLPTVGARVLVSDSKTAVQLGINNDDYPNIDFLFGDQQAELPDDVDVVCVSGGVPLDLPIIQSAVARGIPQRPAESAAVAHGTSWHGLLCMLSIASQRTCL